MDVGSRQGVDDDTGEVQMGGLHEWCARLIDRIADGPFCDCSSQVVGRRPEVDERGSRSQRCPIPARQDRTGQGLFPCAWCCCSDVRPLLPTAAPALALCPPDEAQRFSVS
jgi:hypothetical protein